MGKNRTDLLVDVQTDGRLAEDVAVGCRRPPARLSRRQRRDAREAVGHRGLSGGDRQCVQEDRLEIGKLGLSLILASRAIFLK